MRVTKDDEPKKVVAVSSRLNTKSKSKSKSLNHHQKNNHQPSSVPPSSISSKNTNKNSRKQKKMIKIPTIVILIVPVILSLSLMYFAMSRFNTALNNTTNADILASSINNKSNNNSNSLTTAVGNNYNKTQTIPQISTTVRTKINIPSCDRFPWKPSENLIGSCPGNLKPHPYRDDRDREQNNSTAYTTKSIISNSKSKSAISAKMIEQCAMDCCRSECISWQYRSDVGCLMGGDIRLGMEKDGPSSWCSDMPPKRWSGQYVQQRKNGHLIKNSKKIIGGCSLETWNPNEQPGQCFGLGDVKKIYMTTTTLDSYTDVDGTRSSGNGNGNGNRKGTPITSAQLCMEACCSNDNQNHRMKGKEDDNECGAWQYHDDLGCFYHKRMYGCVDTKDPIVFEPFIGRRKLLPSNKRKYIDKHGNPWTQQQ